MCNNYLLSRSVQSSITNLIITRRVMERKERKDRGEGLIEIINRYRKDPFTQEMERFREGLLTRIGYRMNSIRERFNAYLEYGHQPSILEVIEKHPERADKIRETMNITRMLPL